jgi:3-oxoacyl-[acyl-carrier-protein] synthase-3
LSESTRVRLSGIETEFPAQTVSAAEIARASGIPEPVVREKLGIHRKFTASNGEGPTTLGSRAAQRLLQRLQVDPKSIDVVISIVEEYKEYPVWTAGIKLAYDIGAVRAYAYDLGQKCGSGVLALKQARDLIRADSNVNQVLIAGGYRNGDLIDYRDPSVRFLYSLGAGGAAALVSRSVSGPGYDILESALRTDGSFSLDVVVPVGGTVEPVTAENAGRYRLTVADAAGMKARLEEKSLQTFLEVVREAASRSGRQVGDIAYLAILHIKPSAHRYLMQQLGLPLDRAIYLQDYGHTGQIDTFLSLQLAEQQGKLRDGDFVVAVAAGVGYVWGAIGLEWHGNPS